MPVRPNLKRLPFGGVVVLCGIRGCGGRMGDIAKTHGPGPIDFRWWPPPGFMRDTRTDVYRQTTRSARQFRNQTRRVGRGELPKDRFATEPRGTGRQGRAMRVVADGKVIMDQPAGKAEEVGFGPGAPGSSGLPIHNARSSRLSKCPACGFVNVIEFRHLLTLPEALWR